MRCGSIKTDTETIQLASNWISGLMSVYARRMRRADGCLRRLQHSHWTYFFFLKTYKEAYEIGLLLSSLTMKVVIVKPEETACAHEYLPYPCWTTGQLLGNSSINSPRGNRHMHKIKKKSVVGVNPCGSGLEYFHCSPASRKRRQKGNPVPGG
jgi:hypothetical protein